MADCQIFEAGNVVLQSGLTYRNARLAYKTYGTLNADKSNVIVYPTSYGAQHPDLEWQIGPGRALDPTKYFIVIMNKFGNGLSSSPSNTPPPFDRGALPAFHDDRQCAGAAAPAGRSVRHRAGQARLRLLDGRDAGVSLGRAIPGPGREDRADLRRGQVLAAQFRVSRRGQGGADRRPGLAGRLVRDPADPRLPGNGPGLCRVGPEPSLLPRGAVARRSASPRSRIF